MGLDVNLGKMFAHEVRYGDVDPENFELLLEQFKERIYYWNIKPGFDLREINYAGFTVMGISCIVIDTLCGYYHGIDEMNYHGGQKGNTIGRDFIDFVKKYYPPLNNPIPKEMIDEYPEIVREVPDYASMLYKAFRCKILHETRIPFWGGLSEDIPLLGYDIDSKWMIINPHGLLQETNRVLDQYISDVSEGKNELEFKRRFRYVFSEINTQCWKQ
jgi:hypothetical protein